jgi:hypothetical protein
MLLLAKKNFGAIKIQIEINNVLGKGTVADSTITLSLQKRSFAHLPERLPPEPEIEGVDPIDKAVLQALHEISFASVRQLTKRTLIPTTTICYHCRHHDGIQIEALQMDSSQALGGAETHPGHNVKTAVEPASVDSSATLTKYCGIGRSRNQSLTVLRSFWTRL